MSLSKECQEYHLIPRGWVIGSFKLDAASRGGVDVPTPRHRVLTVGCYEESSSAFSNSTRYQKVVWESADQQAVQQLKEKYGKRLPVRLEKAVAIQTVC